jgi:hypothetical protein
MRKAYFINIILIAVILIFHVPLNANDEEMEMNYKKLFSVNFNERAEAVNYFYELKKDKLDEKYIKALIDLFRREAKQFKAFAEFVQKGGTADTLPKEIAYWNSKESGLYHLYLCRLVSKSEDKSLLNLILENCADPVTMSNCGEDAVEPVVNALKTSKSSEGRTSRIDMLGEMLKPKVSGYVASGNTRNKIKELLVQLVKDNDRYVRSASVRALGDSRDKDVIPMLENIAKNDPYSVVVKDPSGKEVKRYPVRERAEEALQKLKAKEPGKK